MVYFIKTDIPDAEVPENGTGGKDGQTNRQSPVTRKGEEKTMPKKDGKTKTQDTKKEAEDLQNLADDKLEKVTGGVIKELLIEKETPYMKKEDGLLKKVNR